MAYLFENNCIFPNHLIEYDYIQVKAVQEEHTMKKYVTNVPVDALGLSSR